MKATGGMGVKGMTRGQLAKRTGLSMATLRYYEESGILPVPRRVENGYRIYTDDYLVKIKFIKDAKSLGYSLKEIGAALKMLSQDMEAETLEALVQGKIKEIEEKIQSLESIKSMLSGLLQTPQEDVHNYLRSFRVPED